MGQISVIISRNPGSALSANQQLGPDEAKNVLPPLRVAIQSFEKEIGSTLAAAADPARIEETRQTISEVARLTTIREVLTKLRDEELVASKERAAALASTFYMATATLAIGGTVATLVALVMGLILGRAVGTPIVVMTSAMRELANGHTGITVPAIGQSDEIGEMASAVEVFRANAVERIRLEEEAATARSMDQVTQQNAAMVEETSAAGATLANESSRLRGLISQFRLSNMNTQNSHASSSSLGHIAAASPARQLAGKLARAFSGNAAVKEEWQDF